MRIVRQGNLPEDAIYKGTCNNCGAIVECTRSEGQYYNGQGGGSFVKVKCPTPRCGSHINTYKKNDGALIPAGSPSWGSGGGYLER